MPNKAELILHGSEITKQKICDVSGKLYQSTVLAIRWRDWMENKISILTAFPDLDKEQREFWIYGITPDEWREMFPPGIVLAED